MLLNWDLAMWLSAREQLLLPLVPRDGICQNCGHLYLSTVELEMRRIREKAFKPDFFYR